MFGCAAGAARRTESLALDFERRNHRPVRTMEDAMSRRLVLALLALLAAAPAPAAEMKPSAAEKMPSPAEKAKMKACEAKAAAQQVPMDARAKFVMDCTTGK